MHAPLQPHHRRLGQHSPVHCSAVVGDPRRPDSHLPTPAPYPPLPLEGPVRWCALRAPRTNGAAAPHPGTFPGRSQGREALSAPTDPSTCHQRPRPWECGTQLVQQRHLCQQAVKERGSPPVVPGAHPSPCVRSRGTGGQRVSVTRRMRCPGPLLPGGLSVGLPWPAPPGLEHQATLAPHTQGPAPAHTPARARAYTQDDGIFRPPALRWGLVAVDSPLGLGTGQSGCSASWWGREGSPHPRACSCMRPPAQPQPQPPLYLWIWLPGGLGPAGCVEILPQTWDTVVEASSLRAMAGVQLPKTEITLVVAAMTQALHRQGHLVRIERGMPGWGSKPSAPVFVIPKSDVKCSFIMNCKEGNRRYPNPQPSIRLLNKKNMWSLRRRLISWKGSRHVQNLDIFACTFDLSNGFTSLRLPLQAWGTFRVQGEGAEVYDLRSLPFGGKLPPPPPPKLPVCGWHTCATGL